MCTRRSVAKTLRQIFADVSHLDDVMLELAAYLEKAKYRTHYLTVGSTLVVSHYDSERQFLISPVLREGTYYFSVGQARMTDHEQSATKRYGKNTYFPMGSAGSASTIFPKILKFVREHDKGEKPSKGFEDALRTKYPRVTINVTGGSLRISPSSVSDFSVTLVHLPKRDRWQLDCDLWDDLASNIVASHAIETLRSLVEHGLTTKDLLGDTGERVMRLLNQAALALHYAETA